MPIKVEWKQWHNTPDGYGAQDLKNIFLRWYCPHQILMQDTKVIFKYRWPIEGLKLSLNLDWIALTIKDNNIKLN